MADPVHVSDVMFVLGFTQVTKPIIYSRTIRSQVKETNNRVASAAFAFILNILVIQTKFICNGGSVSRRNLSITLSNDIYDSENFKIIHPSSDLHVFWHSRNLKKLSWHRFTDWKGYVWRFLSEMEYCKVVSEGILKIFTTFYDFNVVEYCVIHGVLGYFKCRSLQCSILKWIWIFSNYFNIVTEQ